LQVEFDGSVEITYVMAGIREISSGVEQARQWLEASAATGMPVDPRLWLEGGPTTSYPACLAVTAAAEQGDPAAFLRGLREGFAFRRKRLDHAEAFEGVARDLGGLDLARLRIDMGSHAIMESFGEDLERARGVELPTIEFRGDDGVGNAVTGAQPWEAYRDAALAAGAVPSDAPRPSVEEALRRFGTMAPVEVAAVCDLPGPRAPAELWRLAGEWKARPERTLAGEMWSLA
jgi:predicted DsbA family dithiol-disulfide isomerase